MQWKTESECEKWNEKFKMLFFKEIKNWNSEKLIWINDRIKEFETHLIEACIKMIRCTLSIDTRTHPNWENWTSASF